MTELRYEYATELVAESPFEVLANRTRLQILLALWGAFEPPETNSAVSFSQLYETVDIDDTGNFSYHLEKLRGEFVQATGDGYALTTNGLRLVTAIVTGELVNRSVIDRTPIDEHCPVCGAGLSISYHEQLLVARCQECAGLRRPPGGEGFVFQCTLPPTGVKQRRPTALFRRAVTYELHRFSSFLRRVCPRCAGDVTLSVVGCSTHDVTPEQLCEECHRLHQADVVGICRQCKTFGRCPLPIAVLALPAIRSRLDLDLRSEPFAAWTTVTRALGFGEQSEQFSPLRVGVRLPGEGSVISVILDDSCEVVSIEREVG